MIWVLKDGDEEIGFHYDLEKLLNICDTLKPKHEFHLEVSCEQFRADVFNSQM